MSEEYLDKPVKYSIKLPSKDCILSFGMIAYPYSAFYPWDYITGQKRVITGKVQAESS